VSGENRTSCYFHSCFPRTPSFIAHPYHHPCHHLVAQASCARRPAATQPQRGMLSRHWEEGRTHGPRQVRRNKKALSTDVDYSVVEDPEGTTWQFTAPSGRRGPSLLVVVDDDFVASNTAEQISQS
jgi:hypothetical protein